MDTTELPPESEAERNRRLVRQAEAEQLQQRKDLGAQGKLYSVEIIFHSGVEIGREQLINLTGAEIMELRINIFQAGLKRRRDPNSWQIIPPWCLDEIIVTRQKKHFT